jgi:hypothetical protein
MAADSKLTVLELADIERVVAEIEKEKEEENEKKKPKQPTA